MILYNTLTRSKEVFDPLERGKVGLYTCGPTVYQYAHIGNLRTYLFEDLLRRTLEAAGYAVRHVMNITDVGHLTSDADTGEDKVEVGARRMGKTAVEVAAFFTEAFFKDLAALNCLRPHDVPKATEYVELYSRGGKARGPDERRWDMVWLIQALEGKGLTYRTSDGIYFDTSHFPGYGKLAGKEHMEGLRAGARVEAGPEKRHPADFALWKFSPPGSRRQMEWDSPWGRGFPGWHIECSAMSMDHLGETFDIHCGGVDHVPVHHTNEIAQAEGATGRPFVRWWMHGEFLILTGKAKMAKSAENFLTLGGVLEEGGRRTLRAPYDPLAYRYLCMGAHYRTQLEFSFEAMDHAQRGLATLRTHYWKIHQQAGGTAKKQDDGTPTTAELKHLARFRESLADDLNVPAALGHLWTLVRGPEEGAHEDPDAPSPGVKLAILDEADKVLGLRLDALAKSPPPPEVLGLLKERQAMRMGKDFARADKLRARIGEFGFYVEDTPQGPLLVKKS